jgi:hypothetical protein
MFWMAYRSASGGLVRKRVSLHAWGAIGLQEEFGATQGGRCLLSTSPQIWSNIPNLIDSVAIAFAHAASKAGVQCDLEPIIESETERDFFPG